MSIPKIIHYCWFGGKPLPKEAQKCIASWRKYCPDYKIIEWNESNYDVNKNYYTKTTYANKQWAFLTDYVRLDVIANNGGIYLDTDVELLKPLDLLLANEAYLGQEKNGRVNTGLGFGAIRDHDFIKENRSFYENNNNIMGRNGKLRKIICVDVTSSLLLSKGFRANSKIQVIGGVKIYPVEYFCPKQIGTNKIRITNNTFSIHHFDASWKTNIRLLNKIGYYLIPLKTSIKTILRKWKRERKI